MEERFTRRSLLVRATAGAAALALPGVDHPSPGRTSRVAVKRVVSIVLYGGVSHVDTFDPKPALERFDGTPAASGRLLKSPWTFRPRGRSGLEISDLFPHVSRHADRLCILRSMTTEGDTHGPGLLELNRGSAYEGDSLGATFSRLVRSAADGPAPAFAVLTDPRGGPTGGEANWSAGDAGEGATVLNAAVTGEATALLDLSLEPARTCGRYGLDGTATRSFGRQCLQARRLLERGSRFVQIYHGGGRAEHTWDAHAGLVENHSRRAGEVDLGLAALLQDLFERGLLQETLVLCQSEFGRTPTASARGGRDHNPHGFSAWLAGAGIRPGIAFGSTDELGFHAVENTVTAADLHATVLYLAGLDTEEMTAGARVIHQIIG